MNFLLLQSIIGYLKDPMQTGKLNQISSIIQFQI